MKQYSFFLLLVLLHSTIWAVAQDFDSNFQPFITRPGDVREIRLLPDGGFIVAGDFSLANRIAKSSVARFMSDGTLDQSFQTDLPFRISALDVQADGKVVIGGRYTSPDAPEGLTILRLNTDGSLDQSFQPGTLPDGSLNDIAVESSGSILIGGAFSEFNNQPVQGLVRLSSQGQLLQTFPIAAQGSAFVSELISQADGRFVVAGTRAGEGFVSYRQANGQPVPGFNFSSDLLAPNDFMTSVRDIALDPQGRIVLTASTFLIRYAVAVLNHDGSLLNTSSFIGVPMDLAVSSTGDVLVAGEFENVNAVHRYLPGQGLDIYSLGEGADGTIRTLSLSDDNRILLGGRFATFNGLPALSLKRLELLGQPDADFTPAIERPGIVRSLLRYDDNRVCIGGDFARVGDRILVNVARIQLSDGTADPNFSNPGLYYRNQVHHIALDAQSRLLIAGTNNNDGQGLPESPILRLLPNGTLDLTFTPTTLPVGSIHRLQPLGNGQVLAMGNFAVFDGGLVALDAAVYEDDGRVDEAFSDRFSGKVTACLPSLNGGFFLAGKAIRYDGSPTATLLRLTPDFELDASFQAPAALSCRGKCQIRLTELSDGRLLLGGPVLIGTDSSLVQLQTDGTQDGGFSLGATFYQEEDWVNAGPCAIQPLDDGDLLVVGGFASLGSTPLGGMVRLSPNGSVQDALTQNSFAQQRLHDVLPLSGERVLLAGNLSNASGSAPQGLAIATPMSPPFSTPSISGSIHTWKGEPMGQVEVALSGDQTRTTFTDSLGRYQFDQLQAGGAYTVLPRYDIGHGNGLSIMDLILLNKHILGMELLTNPYQLLAGDTNDSGSITVIDMIAIQRLILGIATDLPANTSWRFLPADHMFAEPTNPWLTPIAEVVEINALPGEGIEHIDFTSLKVGDVSGNAQTP